MYLVAQSCLTLCDLMDCSPPGSSIHGDSSGKNTEVGCHAFLQRIFPTQGSNVGLLCWQADSLPGILRQILSHQGSPIYEELRSNVRHKPLKTKYIYSCIYSVQILTPCCCCCCLSTKSRLNFLRPRGL